MRLVARLTRAAALLMIAGVVVSAATAWEAVLFARPEQPESGALVRDGRMVVAVSKGALADRIRLMAIDAPDSAEPVPHNGTMIVRVGGAKTWLFIIDTRKQEIAECEAFAARCGSAPGFREMILAGWPWRCLAAEVKGPAVAWLFTGQVEVAWGVRIHTPSAPVLGPLAGGVDQLHGVMPLRPLWSGLVPNSLLWAVVLAVVLAVLNQMRRCWRERRGRCPACAYDLRATPHRCPECGWTPNTRVEPAP